MTYFEALSFQDNGYPASYSKNTLMDYHYENPLGRQNAVAEISQKTTIWKTKKEKGEKSQINRKKTRFKNGRQIHVEDVKDHTQTPVILSAVFSVLLLQTWR